MSAAIIPLGRCNERAVFLSISGAATNEEWQRRNHCCGAMLLFAVFLSIYGSGTNDVFRVKAVTWCM